MKFSVLIPVYHGDKLEFLKESVNSILNQTLLPSEILIIVDGKVGADIQEVLTKFVENNSIIKITYLAENKGLGDALNIGLNQCKYDIVARMDADDIAVPNRFERQIEFLNSHPDVDIVGSYIHEFATDPNNERIVRKVPVEHKEIVQYSKRRNPMNHMTVIFKKKEVLKAGSYQRYIGFEDYFLWVRMIQHGAVFHNIPETLVLARTGQGMYKRRGGLQYLTNDVKLQWGFFKSGHVNFYQLLTNVIARSIVRIAPNEIRSKIYTGFLRK